MKRAIANVTCCDDCPLSLVFHWTIDDNPRPVRACCTHPAFDKTLNEMHKIKGDDLTNFASARPAWCPLEAAPVLVRIKPLRRQKAVQP